MASAHNVTSKSAAVAMEAASAVRLARSADVRQQPRRRALLLLKAALMCPQLQADVASDLAEALREMVHCRMRIRS